MDYLIVFWLNSYISLVQIWKKIKTYLNIVYSKDIYFCSVFTYFKAMANKSSVTLFILSIILVLCTISCSTYPKEVEAALSISNKNRSELVTVLEHYRKSDLLKYDAACFLISNMPYHKSKYNLALSGQYQEYFRMVDSIGQLIPDANHNDSLAIVLSKLYSFLPIPCEKTNMENDIQVLTADFLIDNIEEAFYAWQHSPLLKNVTFDNFKEWILPYRTIDEPIVGSKFFLKDILFDRLSVDSIDNIRIVIENYKKYVQWQKEMNKHVSSEVHIGPFDIFIPPFKMDCSNLAALTCNYFRACGIPVVYEFTPQWPDRDSKHYWCASPDSAGILQPYTPPYNNLLEDWPLDLKYTGKVYQSTFAVMKDSPYFLKNKNEILPSSFDIPTIKDVTERYHQCTEITLPISVNTSNKLAYLSFFNTQGKLVPVAWGKIHHWRQTVTFTQVPVNMLFFPSYMADNGQMLPFGKPFMLKKNDVSKQIVWEELECYLKSFVRMHLLRKYPPKRHLVNDRKNLKGARILGAMHWTGPYDTLQTISEIPDSYWQEYLLNNNEKYRYYRIHRDSMPIDIAELEFLGNDAFGHTTSFPSPLPKLTIDDKPIVNGTLKKIEGEPMHTGTLYYKVYDGDPETFGRWGFWGMDFKQPVCISSVRLLPRTAMNIIESGCRYRLLYYQNDHWVEFKEVTSEYNFLDIDSVPAGTIYWLQNLDKGKEELPFFYKDNRQVFINEYIK